jgi:hypothetical protein
MCRRWPSCQSINAECVVTRLSLIRHQRMNTESTKGHLPDDNGSWPPPDAGLNILTPSDVLVQEFQEVIALLLLEADDIPGELGVDKQGLLSRCRVSAHDGVN